jgi:hypothetical protein
MSSGGAERRVSNSKHDDMSELLERLHRASRRSPRYIAKRLVEMGTVRLRRPWAMVHPRMLSARGVVKAAGAPSLDAFWERQQSGPFFLRPSDRPEWTGKFRELFPRTQTVIVESANRVLRHEFDLLGSGPLELGDRLPWHTDFKTGREWPLQFAPDISYAELDRPTDVKVPWELSRCQHFTVLGQAYWLTGDERYADEFVAETTDWIDRNPWVYGVNWVCAMDVALRAVSWIWGFYYMGGSNACASPAFRAAFIRSLYMHGEFIVAFLEKADLNGNHYLCDGVGLVFLGTFFRSSRKGERWLALGKEIVESEIFNQTTADGVDFEKATAYHRLVLEAFLTCGILLEKVGESPAKAWHERLGRMLEFVEAYTKPDGLAPLFGDADDGRVQKLGPQPLNDHRYLLSTGAVLFGRDTLKRSAGRFHEESFWLLGPDAAARFDALPAPPAVAPSKSFPEGGVYVLRCPRAHVVVDCGEVGMNGRGGHGHNDILGFELWLDGSTIVSDCGAYLYTASREWRNRFRSTAFHSVVQIDDEEVNRFVSADNLWQLRDDARPMNVAWRPGAEVDYFRGSHSGYQRLTPPVAICREIALLKEEPSVLVRDSIEGRGERHMTWRLHLAPNVAAERLGEDVRLQAGNRDVWLQFGSPANGLAIVIESGWVSPSYGVRRESEVVVVRGRTSLPRIIECRVAASRLPPDRLKRAFDVLPASRQTLESSTSESRKETSATCVSF